MPPPRELRIARLRAEIRFSENTNSIIIFLKIVTTVAVTAFIILGSFE